VGWAPAVALALVAYSAPTVSAQRTRGTSPVLRQAVTEAVEKHKIPGIAVGFIDHWMLSDIEVAGVRDKVSGAPVTEGTIFETGSLGEPVYSYAILELSLEGRFSVGVPLTKYAPIPYIRNANPFKPPSPQTTDQVNDPRLNQITGERVLDHTSGMPDWALNAPLLLQFPPGEKWSHSNEGFVFLQRVVEKVTGEPTEAFLERSVLGPAGMAHSSFVWRSDYASAIATGYDRPGNAVAQEHYGEPVVTATLYSTIGDYARFLIGMLTASPRQRTHQGVTSLMLNPVVTVDPQHSIAWGLGWGIENRGDDSYFFHWGARPGFRSFAMGSRKSGSGIVIFTNSDNGLDAAREIVQAALGGSHPAFESTSLPLH